MKTILLLGAGFTAPPIIRYFAARDDYRVVIAAADTSGIGRLVEPLPRVTVERLDVADETRLRDLIRSSDIVIGQVPAPLVPRIASLCVDLGRPLISTSYRADALKELHDEASRAGVLLLSEVGLDPGIDHMTAMEEIRRIEDSGGRVTRFMSCCGGIPAQDSHDNPWGYKFSWSPRGVILAGRNPARWLRNGEVVALEGESLFDHWWPYEVVGEGVFEMYPNRDSLAYIEPYGLESVSDMFRGTIRYPGWCATMTAARKLGLFDVEEHAWRDGTTYAEFLTRLVPGGHGPLIHRVADFLGVDPDSDVVTRLEWAGLLSDRRIDVTRAAPIDIFVDRLFTMMRYRPGDRDMVALQHHFTAAFPDGRTENVISTLVTRGERWGDSAMARTVGLPAAIATRLVLEGEIGLAGSRIPIHQEIYRPILAELAEHGIATSEIRTTEYPGPFQP